MWNVLYRDLTLWRHFLTQRNALIDILSDKLESNNLIKAKIAWNVSVGVDVMYMLEVAK